MATVLEKAAPGIGRILLVGAAGVVLGGIGGGLVVSAIQPPPAGREAMVEEAPALTKGLIADGLRYQGMADAILATGGLARGRTADALRYQAQAEQLSGAAEPQVLTRGQAADALRYRAQADALEG